MASALEGKWVLESSENFDEYMKAVGVGLVMRKMANAATPTQEIKVEDGTWSIKTSTTFKTTDISFKVGEEFDETTGDGRKVKTTCKVEGDALVQDQKGSPDSILSREIKEGKMHMILKVNDIVCTRIYKKAD